MSLESADPSQFRPERALGPVHLVVLLAILTLLAAEVFLSNRQESQTWDESAHLYAGYEYWKHADFGRNPEHPPLAKLVAAAGILSLSPVEPTRPAITVGYSDSASKSEDFFNGSKFLYEADADLLLARARGMMLLFPLALALALFAAGYQMFGPEAGLLAALLFALEPMVLGNSGLVTTDIALSCMLFVSVFAFYRYIQRPTASRLLLCGIAAGLTLAAKHSGVFVLPILSLLAFVDLLLPSPAAQRFAATRKFASLALALATIATISYALLWAFYGFHYVARPAGLSFNPDFDAYVTAIPSVPERIAIAFCGRHHLLPEAYLYGWADILHIPGTRIGLVLGKLYFGSRWFLFPELFLIKTTLPLLLLLLLAPYAGTRPRREFLFLAIPAAFYLLVAIASRMNAEARYILPIYPFCIVLAAATAWQIARRSQVLAIAVITLFAYGAASSLHASPDYLAYLNEAAGGPSQSYRLLAGANNDWAQSLKWVKSYTDANHISDCWFDFTDPNIDWKYYGIPCKPLLSVWVPRGYPLLGPVPPTISGTILISATELDGRQWGPGKLNPYVQFQQLQPDAQPGHIVLAYHGTFSVPLLAAYSLSAEAEKLAEADDMPGAIAKSRQAVQLAPDSADIQAGLGITLIEAGQLQEGRQINATALQVAKAFHPEFKGQLIRRLQQPGMIAPPALMNHH